MKMIMTERYDDGNGYDAGYDVKMVMTVRYAQRPL